MARDWGYPKSKPLFQWIEHDDGDQWGESARRYEGPGKWRVFVFKSPWEDVFLTTVRIPPMTRRSDEILIERTLKEKPSWLNSFHEENPDPHFKDNLTLDLSDARTLDEGLAQAEEALRYLIPRAISIQLASDDKFDHHWAKRFYTEASPEMLVWLDQQLESGVGKQNPKPGKPRNLSVEDAHGYGQYTKRVRPIGKGSFSRAYLAKGDRVYVVTRANSGDYAKEILAMINDDTRSKHLPRVKREGYTPTGDPVFSMGLYKAPLRKYNSAKAWAQYRAIEECLDEAFYRVTKNFRRSALYRGHEIMDQTIECASAHPDVPKTLVRALELLYDNATLYGADWVFEFSPRNLATDKRGNLILLDVIYSQESMRR